MKLVRLDFILSDAELAAFKQASVHCGFIEWEAFATRFAWRGLRHGLAEIESGKFDQEIPTADEIDLPEVL